MRTLPPETATERPGTAPRTVAASVARQAPIRGGTRRALGPRDGSTLAVLLLVLVVLSGLGLSLTTRFGMSLRTSDSTRDSSKALYLARAGFEHAVLERLVGVDNWSHVAGGEVFDPPVAFAGGTYSVQLTNLEKKSAEVVATGRYRGRERTLHFKVERKGKDNGVRIKRIDDAFVEAWLP